MRKDGLAGRFVFYWTVIFKGYFDDGNIFQVKVIDYIISFRMTVGTVFKDIIGL